MNRIDRTFRVWPWISHREFFLNFIDVVSITVPFSSLSSPDETIRTLTKILTISSESGDRYARFARRVHCSPMRRLIIPLQVKKGIELNLVRLETPRNSRNNDDRRAEVHFFVLLVVLFPDRVLHRSTSWSLHMYVCMCMRVLVCMHICVRMCAPSDVSPSWCGASLLRPCSVYFLRPRYSTISCNLSFSSSSSSAWMQLVKYCVLKQSCLWFEQRSRTEKSISSLVNTD